MPDFSYSSRNHTTTNVETFYNSAVIECVNETVRECKFNYGTELTCGHDPNKVRTRGAPCWDKFRPSFDSNGHNKSKPLKPWPTSPLLLQIASLWSQQQPAVHPHAQLSQQTKRWEWHGWRTNTAHPCSDKWHVEQSKYLPGHYLCPAN